MTIAEKLAIVAENTPKVYDAGKEDGKKESCDKYMDNLIAFPYANKYAFAGKGWNDETFNPTKSIRPIVCEMMFRESGINDLAGVLERNGVTFDFSRATSLDYFAYGAWITNFPLIDASAEKDLYYAFAYMTPHAKTGDVTLRLKVHENLEFSYCFVSNTRLTELRIEGVIAKNINLSWSPLTVESIESVIWALSGEVGVTGKTATFNLDAVNKAFETEEGANDGSTSDWWNSLVGGVGNWTIALANP
jgi:hypothetical protein